MTVDAPGWWVSIKTVHVGGIVVQRKKNRTKVPCDSFSRQVFLFSKLTIGPPSLSLSPLTHSHTHTHTHTHVCAHTHSSLVHPLLCIQMVSEHPFFWARSPLPLFSKCSYIDAQVHHIIALAWSFDHWREPIKSKPHFVCPLCVKEDNCAHRWGAKART